MNTANFPRKSATFTPYYFNAIALITLPLIGMSIIILVNFAYAFIANPGQVFNHLSIDRLALMLLPLYLSLSCVNYLRNTTILRYNAKQNTFSQRKLLCRWQTPIDAARFRAVTLQTIVNGWRVILLGEESLVVHQTGKELTGNRKLARKMAERIARASGLPFILSDHQDRYDEPFIYRQTAAAEPASPKQRPSLPPSLLYETSLIAIISPVILHITTPLLHGWHSGWMIFILPIVYLLLRSAWWLRQDKHSRFFPNHDQESAFLHMIIFAIFTGIPAYYSLAALFRAAGGETGYFFFALLLGAVSLVPFMIARLQWRILQKPLLSYQADNQTFVLYRWQDYRYTAAHTWPTDNFQGIALRALPIDRWQLLLLGKNGQADILLEEGAEKALRKRQKLLAQSSGMAMLEA